MKKLLSICLFLSALFLSACEPAPSSTLALYDPYTHSEQTLQINSLNGKLLLINYWAEWCKPCITEIPELNQFAKQHADKVVVLGVNFDGKKSEELEKAMTAVNMEFPALLSDPKTFFTPPDINGLPTTLVVNAKGELVQVLLGPQTLASLEKAIDQ